MKRALPWGLAAASLALLAMAGWKAAHPLVVLMTWKTAQANVLDKKFYHGHDPEGFLTYGTELTIHYEAEGHAHEVTVVSTNLTTSFPEPFRIFEALPTDKPLQIRYKPSKPETVEFDTTLAPALPYLAGALLAGLLVIPAFRWQRPKPRCPQCNTQLESYWRYCAECSEPIAKSSPWPAGLSRPPAGRSKG
jgi:hypothetical protein